MASERTYRHSISSRGSSSPSTSSSASFSDDEDAITPCPLNSPSELSPSPSSNMYTDDAGGNSSDNESSAGRRPPLHGQHNDMMRESGELRRAALAIAAGGQDTERLWRRMLELQQMYGCYNSARMQAALEEGGGFVPSQACLELLNDSVTMLPEEAEQLWNHWMALDAGLHRPMKNKRRMPWRRR